MNTQKDLNILFTNQGTCRTQRLLPELVNNDALIDDKLLSDHLKFLYLYTDILAYYDTNNKRIDQNIWRKFLEKDATVIRSLIVHTNVDEIKKNVDKYFLTLRRENSTITESKCIGNILEVAQELIILLDYWYKNLSNEDAIRTKLDVILNEELNPHLSKTYQILKEYIKKYKTEPLIDFCNFLDHKSNELSLWALNGELICSESSTVASDEAVMKMLNDFFCTIFNTIYELKNIAVADYADTLQTQEKAPHIALLIAFIELLQYAYAHLNEIPQRALDHYYRHVLKFNNNPSIPDKAYVHFNLAADTDFCFIPRKSGLIAKNPISGEDILFETDRDICVNNAKINQVNILVTNSTQKYGVTKLSTVYNSDILEQLPFPLFPITSYDETDQEKEYRKLIGLLASPLFYLSEGKRSISIKWRVTSPSFQALIERNPNRNMISTKTFLEELSNKFASMMRIDITTTTGLFHLPDACITIQIIQENCSVLMVLDLDEDVPPIDTLPDEFQTLFHTNTPTVAISLRPGVSFTDFDLINSLIIEKINLRVNVKNYRRLILQNPLGLIDNSQLIEPFGPLPKADSSFYIGSGEIFSKNVTALKINIKWDQVPTTEGGFETHYEAYPTKVGNEDFKVSISYLNRQHWIPKNRQHVPLFQLMHGIEGSERLDTVRTIDNIDVAALGITRNNEPLDVSVYGPNTKVGFLKLKMSGPDQAFGHTIYPSLMSSILVKNIQNKREAPIVLNEPYTPRMQSITIDYEARESIVLNAPSSKEEEKYANTFVHVTAFGHEKIFPSKWTKTATFFPIIHRKVSLIAFGIIGIDSGTLSLHIEIGKNSLNPDQKVSSPSWFYLSDNIWLPIQKESIPVDGTCGCTKSGIIIFHLPGNITTNNSRMKAGLIWLKAQFYGSVEELPTMVGVYTQAVSVTRVMDKNGVFSAPILPENAIQELETPLENIANVVQPFKTFGGRQFENHQTFYRRVSERLRHKNRAVSSWDYEHLVLEKFPEIFKVQCIKHTIGNTRNMASPGHITLVVIAKVDPDTIGAIPVVEKQLLAEIKAYIQTISSPFIQFEVINPVYEDIKVSITVKFNPEYEKGLYINILQQDLKEFLSPWLFDPMQDIRLGEDLPTSKIIDFINKRYYIEGVGNFSILKYVGKVPHLKLDKVTAYNSRLYATYPWSVMVSATLHTISAVDKFDNNVKFRYGGLGDMAIGEDFIIGPWEETVKPVPIIGEDQDVLIPSTEEHYLITKKHIKVDYDNSK